jgi:hypothetical protein
MQKCLPYTSTVWSQAPSRYRYSTTLWFVAKGGRISRSSQTRRGRYWNVTPMKIPWRPARSMGLFRVNMSRYTWSIRARCDQANLHQRRSGQRPPKVATPPTPKVEPKAAGSAPASLKKETSSSGLSNQPPPKTSTQGSPLAEGDRKPPSRPPPLKRGQSDIFKSFGKAKPPKTSREAAESSAEHSPAPAAREVSLGFHEQEHSRLTVRTEGRTSAGWYV